MTPTTDARGRSGTTSPSDVYTGATTAPEGHDFVSAGSAEFRRTQGAASLESELDVADVPVAVTRRRVSDAATRVGRRSRLRAAHVEAVTRAETEGRPLNVGRETNQFVAAMRADIARAALRSARPPLVRYVFRRWVSHRGVRTTTVS